MGQSGSIVSGLSTRLSLLKKMSKRLAARLAPSVGRTWCFSLDGKRSRICRQRACHLLENSGRAEKLETGSPSPVETSANVNVMLGNQNLETESLSGKPFPCPVCGIALDIRISRKQKPYCVCNSCRIQLFFRGKTGIGRLHFSTNVCRAFCCDE